MLIDDDIAQALENWMMVQMKENRGPGKPYHGNALEVSYEFREFVEVINELCPDVVGRMLQAGAAQYLPGVGKPV